MARDPVYKGRFTRSPPTARLSRRPNARVITNGRGVPTDLRQHVVAHDVDAVAEATGSGSMVSQEAVRERALVASGPIPLLPTAGQALTRSTDSTQTSPRGS